MWPPDTKKLVGEASPPGQATRKGIQESLLARASKMIMLLLMMIVVVIVLIIDHVGDDDDNDAMTIRIVGQP